MGARRLNPLAEPTSPRTRRLAQLEGKYTSVMAGGAPVNFGTDQEPDWQTLQVATPSNQLDWLIFSRAGEGAVAAGFGEQPCMPPMRTTSNQSYPVSWLAGLAIVQQITAWGLQQRGRFWAYGDAIKAAPDTDEAVDAIPIEAGW